MLNSRCDTISSELHISKSFIDAGYTNCRH